MKENIFDVLIYLFENYMGTTTGAVVDAESIHTELLEAGFPQPEVDQAFEWLESLGEHQPIDTALPTFRIFSTEEAKRLDVDCRGLLLFLEHSGILTPASRELVIDRVMALNESIVTPDHIKWVVLMALFCLPNEENALARMENLVYDAISTSLH